MICPFSKIEFDSKKKKLMKNICPEADLVLKRGIHSNSLCLYFRAVDINCDAGKLHHKNSNALFDIEQLIQQMLQSFQNRKTFISGDELEL